MEDERNVRYSLDEVRKEIRGLHTDFVDTKSNMIEIQQSLKTLMGVTGLIVILMGAILIWG
mgnify:CR=1 FL=1